MVWGSKRSLLFFNEKVSLQLLWSKRVPWDSYSWIFWHQNKCTSLVAFQPRDSLALDGITLPRCKSIERSKNIISHAEAGLLISRCTLTLAKNRNFHTIKSELFFSLIQVMQNLNICLLLFTFPVTDSNYISHDNKDSLKIN